MTRSEAAKRACELVGGQSALARLLSTPGDALSPQAVQYWCRAGVPAARVLAVELATEGQVTRYDLRPDIYPRGRLPAAGEASRAA